MVGKLKALEKSDDNALVDAVCGSAHQIWQAGLGAFAKARDEGGDLFEKLAQEGASLQKRVQSLATDKGAGVTDTVTRLAENMSRQATGSWEKLEKVFEERVSRSLRSLGVPTHEDMKALSRQIDELQRSITDMAGKRTATKAAAKKSSSKTATKAPAKKTTRSASKSSAKTSSSSRLAMKGARRTGGAAARA